MAGFFGLFDYSKPGPGVQKNGPKKKAFIVFFEIFFRKFWKLIQANLLFALVSIPVFSVGIANSGLSYVTRNFAREKHAFVVGDFFDSVKKNWKQGLAVGLINLIVSVVLAFDLWFFLGSSSGDILSYIMIAVVLSIFLVFTFMKYYLYYMLVTFKLSLKQLYKNSLIFAFSGLARNFLIFIVLGICYALATALLFYSLPIGITAIFLLYIFIYPAFRMLLIQFTVFPMIKKHMIDPYYRDHPEEGKEQKAALNILDDEDEDEVERVFEDTLPSVDDTSKTSFPRQYSEEEMKKLRRREKPRNDMNDDDGTI